MNTENIEKLLLKGSECNRNVVECMILYLSTPIAKRKGVIIPADECKVWVEELEKYLGKKNDPDYDN